MSRLDQALLLHRCGLRLVPLSGKAAIVRDWPELHLGESEILAWNRRDVSWGIVTGDPLVVLDTDSDEAEAWVQNHCIESSVIVRTGGGGLHRYFRCRDMAEIHSRSGAHGIDGLDVKGWRSYVVAPGSIHPETGRCYEYASGKALGEIHELPLFDAAWVREARPEQVECTPLLPFPRGRIRNVQAYIRGIKSIEGQGGDRACFTVACLLAEVGLDFRSILSELELWNQECAFPAWSTTALAHKARYAIRRVSGNNCSRPKKGGPSG